MSWVTALAPARSPHEVYVYMGLKEFMQEIIWVQQNIAVDQVADHVVSKRVAYETWLHSGLEKIKAHGSIITYFWHWLASKLNDANHDFNFQLECNELDHDFWVIYHGMGRAKRDTRKMLLAGHNPEATVTAAEKCCELIGLTC